MGSSRSGAELAAKFVAAATRLQQAQRHAIAQAALNVKTEFIAGAATAGLKPGQRISGVGRKGANWGAGYDIKGTTNPTALVRYRGPVHLVNNPTAPHFITARSAGSSRASRGRRVAAANLFGLLAGTGAASTGLRGALRTPHGPRAWVRHPGTPGKRFWPSTKTRSIAVGNRTYRTAVTRALLSPFD